MTNPKVDVTDLNPSEKSGQVNRMMLIGITMMTQIKGHNSVVT